jgi:hypothetical protein
MTEDLEREAGLIADEAVAGYEKVLRPEVVAEMRRVIVAMASAALAVSSPTRSRSRSPAKTTPSTCARWR